MDFTHTETAEEFKGQGLGKVLAHFALDDVVASGKRIIPHCPFIPATSASTRVTSSTSTGRSSPRQEPETRTGMPA